MAQLMTPTHAAPTLSATEYGYPPSSTIVMDVDYHPDIDDEVDMADPESASVSTPEPVTEPKIPRPLNAFMLYRLDWLKSSKAKAKSKGRSETQGAISRKVSQAWKAEPEAVRDHYKLLAQQAALEHKRRYPTYKYKPGPPKHKNGVKVAPPAQNKRGRPRKVKMPQAVVVAQPASTGSLRSPREGSEETQASSEGANEVLLHPASAHDAQEMVEESMVICDDGWHQHSHNLGYGFELGTIDPALLAMEKMFIQYDQE